MKHVEIPKPQTNILELISYDQDQHARFDGVPIDDLIKKFNRDQVNWINVDGLTDPYTIEQLQSHFSLHALLIEDVLMDQRPKSEEYDDYLFFTLKMLFSIQGGKIEYEQISFVLGTNFLISFQE